MKIDWQDHYNNTDCTAPMQQQQPYGAALALLGRAVVSARVTQHNRLIATTQIILRQLSSFSGLALLPRGPVWANTVSHAQKAAAITLLSKSVPLPHLHALICSCEHSTDNRVMKQTGYIPIMTCQHIAKLDLRPDETARRSAMTTKWRNRLKAAEKTRLKVTHSPLPDDPEHWLLQQDARQRRIKGYRGLPLAFTRAYSRANPRLTRLFTASYDGSVVAAMLFLMHGRSATYHIGWISAEGRLVSAHNLVLSIACSWLASQGYTDLDLGTVDTEAAAGLARFKIGSGADIRPLGATWLHTPLTAGPARLMAHIPPRRRHDHSNA